MDLNSFRDQFNLKRADLVEVLKWSAGLLLSTVASAFRLLWIKRKSEMEFVRAFQEVRDKFQPPKPPVLLSLLPTTSTTVEDARHEANLERFRILEGSNQQLHDEIESVRVDVRQGRTEVENMRRDQRLWMGSILRTMKNLQKGLTKRDG